MIDFVAQAERRRFRTLKTNLKRKQQKYLVLLSNQVVIIDNEWAAMKRARQLKKPIVDMLSTSARMNSQETVLTKLLESLEIAK